MDVPIQYYQSLIAMELAVTGALLFQIRFFVPRGATEREGEYIPDARLRLVMAVVIGVTLFGSLAAMLHDGKRPVAVALTIGLAVSALPILLRVLPPLTRHADPAEPRSAIAVTAIGLVLYVVVIGFAVLLIAI